MADKPILFSSPMIQALLDGRKTQTRRTLTIKGMPGFFQFGLSNTKGYDWTFRRKDHVWEYYENDHLLRFLPYQAGDRLWVRETWRPIGGGSSSTCTTPKHIDFRASPQVDDAMECDHWDGMHRWHPSIHMFRAFSRLTLTVTDVRVQRLQDISDDDAEAEGLLCGETDGGELVWSGEHQTYPIPDEHCHHWPAEAFAILWNGINGPDAWRKNPWVAAYTFTIRKGNIDNG